MYRIGIASFTQRGAGLGERLETQLGRECQFLRCSGQLRSWCRECFESADALIFIGACGIAVRTIAPFLRGKTTDPAVLVIDEAGQFVISLLSGHIGGANEFARAVAEKIGAVPVITTASDVNGMPAVDVFAKKNGLTIASMQEAKRIAAALLRGEPVSVYCSGHVEGTIPAGLHLAGEGMQRRNEKEGTEADAINRQNPACCDTGKSEAGRHVIWISEQTPPGRQPGWFPGEPGGGNGKPETLLHLIPRSVVLGIGCRRNKSQEELRCVADRILAEAGIPAAALCAAASIDLKKEEPGLQDLCKGYGIDLVTYSPEELMRAEGNFEGSEFVRKTTGADNVCERAAILAAGKGGKIIRKKYAEDGVTVALALREWRVRFEE